MATNFSSEVDHIERMRRYLWEQTTRRALDKSPSTWSPEDSTESIKLGWMMANVANTPCIELYSMYRDQPISEVVDSIKKMAPFDHICGKAAAIMAAQLMMHPDFPFSYSTGRANANTKRR